MTKIIQLNDNKKTVLNLDDFLFVDRHEEDTYKVETEVAGRFFRKTVTTVKKTGKMYQLRVKTRWLTLSHSYYSEKARDEDAEMIFSMFNKEVIDVSE
jgi:uncharacterized protein YxjI